MTDRKDVARKALETAKIYSSGFESTLGGPALSLKEAESLGPPKCVLVDCRSVDERKISMVKGSISKEDFEALDLGLPYPR